MLMDNMPDTIYFKDAQSRFTRINRAQAEVLGLKSPDEAIGKTDADFFTPEHAQAARADERRILESGESLISKTERIHRADGSYRWVTATKVPLRDERGAVIGLVGISREVTPST
jgi:PAS domain S-box-containing protein